MGERKMSRNPITIGSIYAIAAYVFWGGLPLYWKLLDEYAATEILAHRIVWSFVFVLFLILLTTRWSRIKDEFRFLVSKASFIFSLLLSSLIISFNWLIYIWAVNTERVVEASLGYYINPLVSVLLGVIFLRERLNMWQTISFVLASIGVAIMTIYYGQVPWAALLLAITFGLYGLAKKVTRLTPLFALAFETLLMLPLAMLYLSYVHVTSSGAFASGLGVSLLLMGAGVVTALPLLWFAHGAQRIPLNMIGFFQYIAPSLTLLLGIFVFQEPFSTVQLVCFVFIWLSVILFTLAKSKSLLSLEQRVLGKKHLGI
jgi:chloramphenicol-sensitive protein RarD